MLNFTKTDEIQRQHDAFITKIDKVIDTLSPYSDITDLNALKKIRDGFIAKTDDFFREERKLNIGVIGQVKAGKSSFLNTLIFEGKKVLPSAATPKTATLTKIEYSEDNKLVIEYYSQSEWDTLESYAKIDLAIAEYDAARETIKMCRDKDLNPSELIAKGSDEFAFGSAEELMDKLDAYVGEDGQYTALVKNVVIYINKPELEGVSVVDTPGLNDAIASRTDRTRQFLDMCDVVFFLSPHTPFLDKKDMQLLTSQLPQKGAKKLVLICSRFDQSIRGKQDEHDSTDETITAAQKDLTRRAEKVIGANTDPLLAKPLESCRKPIFVSSMCWNMAQKGIDQFDKTEQKIFDQLNEEFSDVTIDTLKRIGNIDAVQAVFDDVVANTDEYLSAKARDFIPTGLAELRTTIDELRSKAAKTQELLKSGDSLNIDSQKAAMIKQINAMRGEIEGIFGELLTRMESHKSETLRNIREDCKLCSDLHEKQGTEEHMHSKVVSDSKWYNPFSWGKSHRESYTTTTTYTYIDSNDALENIRNFSMEASSEIEKAFSTVVDIIGTKRKLLGVIVNNSDTSSELYDAGFFKMITEQVLNKFEFPVIRLDVSDAQNAIASKFSGQVRDGSERSMLRKLTADTFNDMLKAIEDRFVSEIATFRTAIETMKIEFTHQLLSSIEEELDKLQAQIDDRDNAINNYSNLLVLIKQVDSEL